MYTEVILDEFRSQQPHLSHLERVKKVWKSVTVFEIFMYTVEWSGFV